MPGGDGTGPMGFGPRRAWGYCAGYGPWGGPRGRGWRCAPISRGYQRTQFPGAFQENEAAYLKQWSEYLEDELRWVKGRIENMRDQEDSTEDQK